MVKLLLIGEDDSNGVLLLREAFREAKLIHPIVDVPNGRWVISYLSGKRPFLDRRLHPMPDLVLLDLRMPVCDGFEVLAWRQTRPELKTLPIVILSGSALKEDMKRARVLGADEYLVKPPSQKELVNMVMKLNEHWLAGRPRAKKKATALV
jgi:two-component system response regulator